MKVVKEIGIVKCDKCDWRESSKDIASWYGIKCPKCKNSIIIDDRDMEILKEISDLRTLGIVLPNNTKKKDIVKVRLSTKGLR